MKKHIQRFRSFLIWHTSSLGNWINKHIVYDDLSHPIGVRDHLRWWLDDKLTVVFAWAWDGSDEELAAVEREEIPVEYMSDRQYSYHLQIQAGEFEHQ